MKFPSSRLIFGTGGAILAAAGLAVAYFQHSGPVAVPAAPSQNSGRQFASIEKTIDLGHAESATIHLGSMPLGAIRDLELEISGLDGGALDDVQSSCSCLQPGELPEIGTSGQRRLSARYFAVRPGMVDVTLAISHVDASGNSGKVTTRIIGEVQPGNASRSDQLAAFVMNPLFTGGMADPAIFADAGQALAAVGAGRGLLIDVRSVEEYSHEHAVGSLNIPLAELKPNGAFRGREIFLIGPALATGPMQKVCAQLKRQGVDHVAIVPGGVQAWQAGGGKVFQELDPQPVIGSLSILDVAQRVAPLEVKFCGLGLGDEFAFRYHFAGGTLSPAGADPVAWIERQLAAEPSKRLVLIDGTGKDYGSLNQAAPPHWLGRVYYLRAGFADYLQEVTRMSQLAAAPPGQRTSSVHGFARRDKIHRTNLPSSPGCGTCPK